MLQKDLNYKLQKLKNNLKEMGSVLIAFSGGTDSTFLVKVAYDILAKKAVAITATSSMYPQWEFENAKKYAKNIGIKHITIELKEMEIKNFQKNPINRCYYCKKELFSKIKKIANDENLNYILDGSNVNDETDYRPGIKALKELDVISPLKDVELTKKEIKELSHLMNLETWNKPAFACLASRFPYGVKITKSRLEKIENAEVLLRSLKINQFRVRYHEKIARIEVDKNDFQLVLKNANIITKKFKELGFKYITLDIEGYRGGSLNEGLKL